jgi:peptidoglycan hydrolase-like amidase
MASHVDERLGAATELTGGEPGPEPNDAKDPEDHGSGSMLGTVPGPIASMRPHRRSSFRAGIAAMMVSTVVMIAPPAVAADAEPTIEFTGGGWGHSVGLSQYGAKGQAMDGRSAEQIVTHYFTDTEVADVAELPIPAELQDRDLWIGLDQHLTTANFAWSGGDGTVCIDPGAGGTDDSCDSTVAIYSGDHFTATWKPAEQACSLVRTRNGNPTELNRVAPDCRLSLRADPGSVMWFEARGYPAGATIELRRAPSSGTFHVVAAIDMETYVAGIAEVPTSWPAAAIEAQALAARSYALNRYLTFEKPELRAPGDTGLRDSMKDTCWCHAYDDSRSQVYGGTEHMTAARIAAAQATADQVIAYRKSDWASFTRYQVIEAYYSSSNGGASQSNVLAWGSVVEYPYLVSVDDPWSTDPGTGNPYASWDDSITASSLAAALGWDSITDADLVDPDPATSTVRVFGIDGGAAVSTDLRGGNLRGKAGLLSSQVWEVRVTGPPRCAGRLATIWGTDGPDELIGTDGDDVIVGLGGKDVIQGGGGDDLICGNGGNDVLKGNLGRDTLYGGAGKDRIRGGGGEDLIAGGPGADKLWGGNRSDVVNGREGDDQLFGDKGRDLLRGGDGHDVMAGGNGVDDLYGNDGDDQLFGNAHADRLWGGPGDDLLDGGPHPDECAGGSGIDEAAPTCELVSTTP